MEENDEIKKIIGYESPNPEMRILNKKDAYLEKDILTIASRVFNTERAIKRGKKVEKLTIPISDRTDTGRDIEKIAELIHDLFLYVLIEDINIEFNFDKVVAQVASTSKIPPSKWELNATAPQTSGGEKSQSATVSLKQIDVVKFAEFLSTIQLRWANLQCNRVKLTKKPGLPDTWDVDIEFKYYY